MTAKNDGPFRIVPAADGPAYEGLRALWSRTFGDPPSYADAFYANFGDDIKGWAVVDGAGEVCSALTCHLCGEYEGRPVYVSYAVCTREDMRGRGLAAMLTTFVRDEVTAAGGISLVSPAEPSLAAYYEKLGYEPHFFAVERAVMSPEFDPDEFEECDEYDLVFDEIEKGEPGQGGGALRPEIDLQPLSAEQYSIYREAFLDGRPHITPTDAMLRLMESECEGAMGFCSVNRGDAVCMISSADPAKVCLSELILNPVLQELSLDIDSEIASMIASHFDSAETVFTTPGAGAIQGMVCGLPDMTDKEPNEDGSSVYAPEPYYGFPIQ